MTVLTTQEARWSIVVADPSFCNMVGDALFECDTPRDYHDLCLQCAAYLQTSRWLDVQCKVVSDVGGLVTEEDVVQQRTREAIKELRACGVLPHGFAWLMGWALRRAVTAFLESLIRQWLRNEQP